MDDGGPSRRGLGAESLQHEATLASASAPERYERDHGTSWTSPDGSPEASTTEEVAALAQEVEPPRF